MKATLKQCREGFVSLADVFKAVKLPLKPGWHVGRVLDLLEQGQKKHQRQSSKLYMDAGAVFNGVDGFAMPPMPRRRDKESDEAFENRELEYRRKMNQLYHDLEKLDAQTVDIARSPIPLSWFPIKEKDEQGKDVETNYPTVALAYIGTFVADDVGLDAPAQPSGKEKKK